jgi:hypothetical protein
MALQAVTIGNDNADCVSRVVNDLSRSLDRLDMLGLTGAGAKLATVLDLLRENVSDSPGSSQETQS